MRDSVKADQIYQQSRQNLDWRLDLIKKIIEENWETF